MFKVVKGLAPKIFSGLLPLKEHSNYSTRQKYFFKIPRNKTACVMISKASHIKDQKIGKYCHKKYRNVSLVWNLKSKSNYGIP